MLHSNALQKLQSETKNANDAPRQKGIYGLREKEKRIQENANGHEAHARTKKEMRNHA
tara:strand:- start:1515 stop:1688 length:174 start_codon:yes stop_codon:yes gene_type:complete